MITFEKWNKDLATFIINDKDSEIYLMKKDDAIIGYGKINADINNKISLSILPEYRGNGYGKQLFNYLIKTIHDVSSILITFENDNVIAKRIIENGGGKQVSLTNGIVQYVLPLNNNNNL